MAGKLRKHCVDMSAWCRCSLSQVRRRTMAKKNLVAPPVSPSLTMTEMVRHSAMKIRTAWKMCAAILNFWMSDWAIRILACGVGWCVYVCACVCGRVGRRMEALSGSTGARKQRPAASCVRSETLQCGMDAMQRRSRLGMRGEGTAGHNGGGTANVDAESVGIRQKESARKGCQRNWQIVSWPAGWLAGCRSLSLTPAASTILCHASTLTGPAINSHNTMDRLDTDSAAARRLSLCVSLPLSISISTSTVDMNVSCHRSPRRPSSASTPHLHLHLRVPPVLQSA
jgi:hypothetical protein